MPVGDHFHGGGAGTAPRDQSSGRVLSSSMTDKRPLHDTSLPLGSQRLARVEDGSAQSGGRTSTVWYQNGEVAQRWSHGLPQLQSG